MDDHIFNQMDKIGLMSLMSNDDFMLHIMGNLPKEYETVVTNTELMVESGEKLTIELMYQSLNAHLKNLQSNKEEVEEEEQALAAIEKQGEEKALAVWNKQQFKDTCRNCGKY